MEKNDETAKVVWWNSACIPHDSLVGTTGRRKIRLEGAPLLDYPFATSRRRTTIILVLAWILCIFALTGCASKAIPMWRAGDIETQPNGSIELTHEGKTLGTVSRDQVRLVGEVKARIERVVPEVTADLFIQADAAPNAFASGDVSGKGRPVISITLGMLDLVGADMDAYAAIIGHEYAHLALHHGETRQQRRTVSQAASTALGFLLSAAGVPLGGTVADFGVTAVERIYSRDEETQADRQGYGYLVAAGYDPAGAVRLWEKMQTRQSANSGFSIPFLASHPVNEDRIAAMKKLASGK